MPQHHLSNAISYDEQQNQHIKIHDEVDDGVRIGEPNINSQDPNANLQYKLV